MPIDHRGDVCGGGLLDGDEVSMTRPPMTATASYRPSQLLEALQATVEEGEGKGKGGSGKDDRKGKSNGWGKGNQGGPLTPGRQWGQGQL